MPVPGWTGEYEWVGYIPYEQLPHLYNPPQGYVATANNRVVRDDYPYFVTADCCSGDRMQRIVELIEAQPQIDVGYIERMHQDQVCPTARTIAHLVGQLQVEDPELAAVVAMLRGWDGRPGWLSTRRGKALAFDAAADALREGQTLVRDRTTLEQMMAIRGASLSAPPGEHDDRAVAHVLALAALRWCDLAPTGPGTSHQIAAQDPIAEADAGRFR